MDLVWRQKVDLVLVELLKKKILLFSVFLLQKNLLVVFALWEDDLIWFQMIYLMMEQDHFLVSVFWLKGHGSMVPPQSLVFLLDLLDGTLCSAGLPQLFAVSPH